MYTAKCIYAASAKSREFHVSVEMMKTALSKDRLRIYNLFSKLFGYELVQVSL